MFSNMVCSRVCSARILNRHPSTNPIHLWPTLQALILAFTDDLGLAIFTSKSIAADANPSTARTTVIRTGRILQYRKYRTMPYDVSYSTQARSFGVRWPSE